LLFRLSLHDALPIFLFFKKNHKYMSKAIDPATLSSTVSPGEDFYQFVNGSWAERTEIPSDRGRWGSFDELRKLTNERSLALLREDRKSTRLNSSHVK